MTNNQTKEFAAAGVLIFLLVVLMNPFHFWMPTMAHMTVLAGAVVVFGLFSSFILREQAGDEREDIHRMFADRVAFLVGASMLTIGIIYQSYYDMLDVWLVAVLVAMIVAKIASRIYGDRHW